HPTTRHIPPPASGTGAHHQSTTPVPSLNYINSNNSNIKTIHRHRDMYGTNSILDFLSSSSSPDTTSTAGITHTFQDRATTAYLGLEVRRGRRSSNRTPGRMGLVFREEEQWRWTGRGGRGEPMSLVEGVDEGKAGQLG